MAVTAHWIETQEVETPEGKQYILNLCADLAAFHYVPGRHSGIHLATAFLETLDRINLAPKVRIFRSVFQLQFFTLDNV